MRRSTDHILTSHVGSLPRPKSIEGLLKPDGDNTAYLAALPAAVKEIVQTQREIGLDVGNDGELSKMGSWSGYIERRLAGYESKLLVAATGPEQADFPEYHAGRPRATGIPIPQMVCTGPISYIDTEIKRDVANLQAATEGLDPQDFFMCSVSPDNINYNPGGNEYYASEEEFIAANAKAMRGEYEAITDAGFTLQIDMPVQKFNFLRMTVEQFRTRLAGFVEVLNDTLTGIPPKQVRVHICYGGGKQPHTGDIGLGDIIDLVLKLNVTAVSFDQNVRHEHEWHIFEDLKLPEGKMLMPGVVAHTTDVIEHPEVISERLVRLGRLVGRENVMAGTDCGLGGRVPREIAWAKFASMVEGARLATERLSR